MSYSKIAKNEGGAQWKQNYWAFYMKKGQDGLRKTVTAPCVCWEEGNYTNTADIVTGKVQMKQPKRMEIWFADLGDHPDTCVQEGYRPVLIISNDTGNEHAETLTVVPLTSKQKKWWLPVHVSLLSMDIEINDTYTKKFEEAMILLEQIVTVDKSALRTYVGRVIGDSKKAEIEAALRIQLGMEGL